MDPFRTTAGVDVLEDSATASGTKRGPCSDHDVILDAVSVTTPSALHKPLGRNACPIQDTCVPSTGIFGLG